MLLAHNNISIELKCQQFVCKVIEFKEDFGYVEIPFESQQDTKEVCCPECYNSVEIYDNYTTFLKDMPIWQGKEQYVSARIHRYRCPRCGKTFSEDVPMRYPGTRITDRAANWIRELLRWRLPISAVHEITGIHWDTIRKIHMEIMEAELESRKKQLKDSGYKPKYLAIDEFAIHKGHKYATCVMDIEQGDVIWVGIGRSMPDFNLFFSEVDMDYLSDVEAIAMDMNASYNRLVAAYMPEVQIVYDRYHTQAQYGKDVLGSVRLSEARAHQQRAKEIDELVAEETDPVVRKQLRKDAKEQRHLYSKLKGARWTLLKNSSKLEEDKTAALNEILNDHSNLAVCYAMKEEMCELFELRDPEVAEERWSAWFEAAKTSGIAPLVKFAELKEKRIDGLVAHARYPISTGKLEGFNNKIKVAKRIGYGYRNLPYFFTLIQYLTVPSVRYPSPKIP